MRKLIRNSFWILLLIFVVFTWIKPLEFIETLQTKTTQNQHLTKDAKSKLTYLISKSQWLTFNIPSFAEHLKFLLTANFPADMKVVENISDIHYSIKYEFLDDNNNILSSKTHHLRTAFLLFQDDNKSFLEKSFYLDAPLHPTTSKTLLVSLKNYPDASKIRLKIETKDPRIVDVGLRSYHLENIPEYRKDIEWERMSRKKRKDLSRGNIYDISHMTKSEKRNIVSFLWKPNGPLGVQGTDYEIRRLFVLTQLDKVHIYTPVQPNFYADENLSATRYVKQEQYDIIFTPMTTFSAFITLKHYVGSLLVSTQNYSLDNTSKTIHFDSQEEGIIEITSTQGVSILIKEHQTKESLDIPPMMASEYYDVDSNKTLDYHFYSSHKRFVRVECRSSNPHPAMLTIELKNKQNKTVQTLHHAITFIPSRYDYIEPFVPQSEPFYLYVEIPAHIQAIELSSTRRITLRLATRSESMVYPIYSFPSYVQPEFNRLASWFTLRPENFNHQKLKDRRITLYKQLHPPVVNSFIQTGKYDYEQLYPQGRWQGHGLLLKRPLDDNYIRPQSWKGIYTKVDSTKETHLVFKDDIGLKETSPTLIYRHTESYVKPFSIYLDDVVVSHKALYGTSGSIPLPTTSLKEDHILHFENQKNIDFFISNTTNGSEVYFKRNFITFDKPLKFNIKKSHSEESIGFQLAIQENETIKVLPFQVHIESNATVGTKTHTSFTFKEYLLHADTTQHKAIYLTHHNRTLSVSDPMYLNLGENLPAGEYTITVYPPKTSSKGYLFMNHLILDQKAKTRVSKEIL